jgi:hypothetical protein
VRRACDAARCARVVASCRCECAYSLSTWSIHCYDEVSAEAKTSLLASR